jgi:predicted dienelactone hydrolase
MRPLEVAGFAFAIVPALVLLTTLPAAIGIVGAVISCGILFAAVLRLGAYWQLFPLYLAAVLGLAALLLVHARHGILPKWMRAAAASAVLCLLMMTATFSAILPMFRLPQPSGKYAVGTRIVHLVDPVRMETHVAGRQHPREIMVQIWYPASPNGQHLASYRRKMETTKLSSYMDVLWTHSYGNAPLSASGGPFPVLLFNPAWGRQRTQNTYQTEDLASHGFIVAAIDHPYNSTPVAFPDGRIVDATDAHDITDFQHTTVAQQIAIGDAEVHIQAGDDILALNYLAAENSDPGSPWFRKVDVNDVGAFGHSFGGAVAAQACYQDPRIRAALNEDGWMFGDVPTQGLNKPFLVMYEDVAQGAPPNSTELQNSRSSDLDALDLVHLHQTMRANGGYMLTLLGSRHNDFSDRSIYSPLRRLTDGGKIVPRRAHEIIEAYTLQFFSRYLLRQPAPLLNRKDSPYKEVQFENWFAKNALTD